MAAPARIGLRVKPASSPADDDADVDDHLAPPIEDRVHERPELADLAGRAGERPVEHVEGATDEHDDAADRASCSRADEDRAGDGDGEPDQGQDVRRQAERGPSPRAIGSKMPLTRERVSFEMVIAWHWLAMPRIARSRSATSPKASGTKAHDRLATDAAGVDEAGDTQALEVVADERLAQADVGDELGDAGLTVREASDDAQPIHVGEGLVEGAQLAQVVGLEDDRGDGRAEPGGRRHGMDLRGRRSPRRRINVG